MSLNLFITGTGTGVGKTVLGVLLTRTLLAVGADVLAVKPFCSGGREDARALLLARQPGLRAGVARAVSDMDAINPWHFREALAPLVAARRTGRAVRLREVLAYLRAAGRDREILVVEGAGGLLSPLAEGCDARRLIAGLEAVPVLVAANGLGVLNQVLLAWAALPPGARRRAHLVLMEPPQRDLVARTNGEFLSEKLGPERVHRMPRLSGRFLAQAGAARIPAAAAAVLERLVAGVTG